MPHDDRNGSEELLIQKAIAGDKHAFGRLYELYADRIYRYLFYRSDEGHEEAADMTELVFLRAWENLSHFGKRGRGENFKAWLYRIAHNALIDHHRTKKEKVSLETVPDQPSDIPHTAQLVEESERLQSILKTLDNLDPLSRQVIVLRFFSGLNNKETADVIGISAGNVRVIQYRALKKIKEFMDDKNE